MKIFVEIGGSPANPVGLERYCINLINALSTVDKHNKYIIMINCFKKWFSYNRLWKNIFKNISNNFELNVIPFPEKVDIFFDKYHKSFKYLYAKYKKADLYYSATNFCPCIKDIPTAVTIYDVGFIINNDWYPDKSLSRRLNKSISNADKIFTISDFSKTEIIKYFNLAEEKIEVIYPGIDHLSEKPSLDNLQIFRQNHSLPEKFILNVGTINKRKNQIGAIKVFNILKQKYKIPHKLILIGKNEIDINDILNEKEYSYIRNEIIIKNYVNESEISYYYSLADIFYFPSYYEGFGFPCLEALHYNTPVICSNIPVLKEICGDGVIFVNPDNIDSCAEKTMELIENKNLRDELLNKSYNILKRYKWLNTAKTMIKNYNALASLDAFSKSCL